MPERSGFGLFVYTCFLPLPMDTVNLWRFAASNYQPRLAVWDGWRRRSSEWAITRSRNAFRRMRTAGKSHKKLGPLWRTGLFLLIDCVVLRHGTTKSLNP